MTRIIAALEKLGLVVRVVDPTDRRVARVRVSEAGREVLEQNRSLKNAFLALQLHSLTSDERDALGGLTALIERLAEGLEP
jgi:DNA-binding MarR family transcriptional regulator